MTPAPIIVSDLGISLSDKASVDVIILSLSMFINGKVAGFDPVAITHLSNLIL